MTRARSLLAVYGIREGSSVSRTLSETISACVEAMNSTPDIEIPMSIQDDLNDILDRIGHEHRKWLVDLWKRYDIRQEPITDSAGALLAEPLFWFTREDTTIACFGCETDESHEVASPPYRILMVGEDSSEQPHQSHGSLHPQVQDYST